MMEPGRTEDASDNPLISNSGAYPCGYDEGMVAYGTLKGLGWIASLTDGRDLLYNHLLRRTGEARLGKRGLRGDPQPVRLLPRQVP